MSNPLPNTIIIITPHGSTITISHGGEDFETLALALRKAADHLCPPPPLLGST